MYKNLGYQWASFVPAGIGFLLSLTPYVLFVYGPKLRQKVGLFFISTRIPFLKIDIHVPSQNSF